jgi:hypothetical protein
MLTQRFPGVRGIVADANSIPLNSFACDVVTSQFGLEYAGINAIDELIRVVSPGGHIGLLLHHGSGGIYRQCASSLDAVVRMRKAKFLPLAASMLEEGFAAGRGENRANYSAASSAFIPALREMELIMKVHGQGVADGTIIGLYRDIRTIHGSLPNYDPDEISGWLRDIQREMKAYERRMASMCDAAIDASTFARLCNDVRSKNFELVRANALINPERNLPLAWVLVARKT